MWYVALISLFLIGSATLTVAFGVFWADWWDLPGKYESLFGEITYISVVASIILTILLAIAATGQERWLAFSVAAILMLGFSALTIISIGGLLGPLSLLLLVFSVARLIYLRSDRCIWHW